jgi:hypothetical protein
MRKRRLVLLHRTLEYLRILNRKFEGNVLVCQAVVNASECIQLGLNINLVLRIKVDLEGLGAIDLVANSLTNDFSWVDNILEDLLVNMGQSS